MKSLAHISRDMVHHHERAEKFRSTDDAAQIHYLPLSEQAGNPQAQTQATAPSREDVLNYLGHLADDYHLPPKLVYAVADAESSVHPDIKRRPNYVTKNGKIVKDKNGNPRVDSWDYGLMQINDKSRIGETVKDPEGHRFRIGEDIETDWKANARAAVAILAHEYGVAELEQGPGATAEDRAQQTYSAYTHSHRKRDFYLRQDRNGLPANRKDRNFLEAYRRWR